MKKIIAIFLFLIAVFVVNFVFFNSKPTMTGRAILSKGTVFVTDDTDMPIQLNPKTANVFSNCQIQTGDLIKITYTGEFLYSSPPQTTVFKVEVLEKGSIFDLSPKTILVLENYRLPIE